MTHVLVYKTNTGTYITNQSHNRILLPELPTDPGITLGDIPYFLGYKDYPGYREGLLEKDYDLAVFQLQGLTHLLHIEDSGKIERSGTLREETLVNILGHHQKKLQDYSLVVQKQEERAENETLDINHKANISSSLIKKVDFEDLMMKAFLLKCHEKSDDVAYAIWTHDSHFYTFDQNANLLHPESVGKPLGTPMYYLENGCGFPKDQELRFAYRDHSAESKAVLPVVGRFNPIMILGVSQISKALVDETINSFFSLQEYDVWYGNRIKQIKSAQLAKIREILQQKVGAIKRPTFQQSIEALINFK
ncbi:hypothetical protein HQ489_04085 [Candidatus Woesearchaeota archaeon]|nr:hypothetical protein [Candidatus Woesearchaeota archaeon]